ncbi:MAG TPA: endospore germination permease [Acetivibrio sp.]|nr:endospore germination permease [Acetivibrio sp.]
MEKKIIFGNREAISLLLIFMCNQLFLSFPRNMAESAGNAGWILTIYITVISLVLFLIISRLYKNFEGKDILDVAEFLGGNIGRILVGIIYVIDYVVIISVILREYGEDLKIISLVQSPISFVLVLFAIGMVFGAFFGLEPLVRLGAISVPVIFLGFLITVVGSIKYFNFSNILPIFGTGPVEILIEGPSRTSVFSGLTSLFLIAPFLRSHDNFKKSGFIGLILSGLILTVGNLVYSLVLPYPSTTSNFLPIYQLSRLIEYGRFFQRIESIFVLVWSMTALIHLSAGLFFSAYIYKKTFKLEYHRPLIIPFCIIIFTLSLIPKSLMETMFIDNSIIKKYAWTVTFGLTLVLLILASIKIKVKEGRHKDEK